MRSVASSETVALIVKDYQRGARRRAHEKAWWRADGEPFAVVLDRVGRADLFGKRHPHQRRLSGNALECGRQALHRIADRLQDADDFYSLMLLVGEAFGEIRGLGELAIYDTAERLRHRLDLEAKHLVHLHAGARIGARRLLGGKLPRGDAWGVLRHQLPEGLWHLSTHEIEDILCIYKDDFFLTPDEFRARRGCSAPPGCGDGDEAGGC